MQKKIRYLGQNGFWIRDEKRKICFDLYLSNTVYEETKTGKRNYPAPCTIEDIKDTDYYFISHEHMDHMDIPTICEVGKQSEKIIFCCPNPWRDILKNAGVREEQIIGMSTKKKISLSAMEITSIPVKHEQYVVRAGEHGCLGYIVDWDGFRFFHAGDALADEKLMEALITFAPFDVVFLPINGHDPKRYGRNLMGNMTYREALDLAVIVGAKLVVPMHYDLFRDNTENPAFFVDYLYREYPGQAFKMFAPGEEIIIEK